MSHVATVVALTLDSDIYTPKMCARPIYEWNIYILLKMYKLILYNKLAKSKSKSNVFSFEH